MYKLKENELTKLKSITYKKKTEYLGRSTDYDCQACVSSDCPCNVCDL